MHAFFHYVAPLVLVVAAIALVRLVATVVRDLRARRWIRVGICYRSSWDPVLRALIQTAATRALDDRETEQGRAVIIEQTKWVPEADRGHILRGLEPGKNNARYIRLMLAQSS